jgi:hypothetical protein
MDIRSQILVGLEKCHQDMQRDVEIFRKDIRNDCQQTQKTMAKSQEKCNLEIINIYTKTEYDQESYAKYNLEFDCNDWYMESYNMEIIGHCVTKEYNQETYAWSYWEAECDAWYMDSYYFWDDNPFHILFDDFTPPSVEHILERRQEPSMHNLL